MVTDGQLIDMDGKFKAANDPSDDVDPNDADLDKLSTTSEDPTEIFVDDRLEDEEDEKGAELKRKYEKGFMRGFSVGIDVKETSSDNALLRQGQRRETGTLENGLGACPHDCDSAGANP
jgi:hypothetical protein